MAYISIEVLDHEYNAFQTNMKLVSIGCTDFVGFGKLMNEKYNFKADNLNKLSFKESYDFIKKNFIK